LHRSFYLKTKKRPITIFYGTGCLTVVSNQLGLIRAREVKEKYNHYFLSSTRYLENPFETTVVLSDALIVLGNDFTRRTYSDYFNHPLIKVIKGFFYKTKFSEEVVFSKGPETKKTFLWLGSSGLIHKGFDLLVEAFCQRTDLKLHICGNGQGEIDFVEAVLSRNKCSNVIIHGFVDIDSETFKKILSESGFVIFPSLTEGSSPSVLTAMGNGGCVPIISQGSSVDIGETGVYIEDISVEGILAALDKVLVWEDNYFLKKVKESYDLANYFYNIDSYKFHLEKAIIDILERFAC
jgi:hypothetical protein